MFAVQGSPGFPFLVTQARSEELENIFFLTQNLICCWDVSEELRRRGII